MKDRVLVVEDNESILFNVQLTLEMNGYEVISAKNGKEAIAILHQSGNLPHLILSDIMMPTMNGYEFFEEVSKNRHWGHIPFIFVSAKSSPTDVRLAKILGADDYITKPINDEILLEIINKKIQKSKKFENLIDQRLRANFKQNNNLLNTIYGNSIRNDFVIFFIVEWDELLGPLVTDFFPIESKSKINVDAIALQLFQTTISIYGSQNLVCQESVRLNVQNMGMTAFLLFDTITDNKIPENKKEVMICVLASEISYFKSLELKNSLSHLMILLKTDEKTRKNRLEKHFNLIKEILIPCV